MSSFIMLELSGLKCINENIKTETTYASTLLFLNIPNKPTLYVSSSHNGPTKHKIIIDKAGYIVIKLRKDDSLSLTLEL